MDNSSLINSQLGKYVIQAEIGRGGMGAVYRAYDPDLKRHVAIKVLAPHLVWETGFVERFLREAQAAAQLKHPAIVTIHDVGQHESWYYFVMELLAGQTLTEFIRQRGPLPPNEVLALLSPLAAALEYAHGQGLVHRDIKPANIIIDATGQVTLTDFGIVQAGHQTRLTATGAIIGTPEYMSPEQALGMEADARSDQYSLGVVSFELLSGRVPFRADSTLALLHKVAYEPPPPIRELRPELPQALETVLTRALAKEPDHRFATVTTFVEALGDASAGQVVEEIQVPSPQITPEPVIPTIARRREATPLPAPAPVKRRGRAWIPALGGIIAAALAMILLLFLRGGEKAAAPRPLEPTSVPTTTPTASLPVTYTPDMQATDAAATVIAAAMTVSAPTPTAVLEPSPTADNTPLPPPMTPTRVGIARIVYYAGQNGQLDIYIINTDRSGLTPLTTLLSNDMYPVVSPDGRRIVFQSDRDANLEIYVMDIDGGNQTRLTFDASEDSLPNWSPDGRQILFSSDRDGDFELYVMDANGGNLRQLTNNTRRDGHASWSSGGQIVFNAGDATDSSTWEIYIINADGGGERRLTNNDVNDWSPNWSPDGRQILFLSRRGGQNDPALWVVNADGSGVNQVYNIPGAYDWGASWSPDGRFVVFTSDASGQDDIFILELSTGDLTRVTTEGGMYPSWVP